MMTPEKMKRASLESFKAAIDSKSETFRSALFIVGAIESGTAEVCERIDKLIAIAEKGKR